MLKYWLTRSAQAGYLTLATATLLVGLAGAVTPLLPTTPFLLVAAWAAAKSSPRLHHWLMSRSFIGEPVLAWRNEGAIPSSTKRMALAMLAVSALSLFVISSNWLVVLGVSGLLGLIGLFIASRPKPHTEPDTQLETVSLYEGCGTYRDLRAYSDPEVFHE